MEYEVVLDMLSGLPNPTWRLDIAEVDRLQQWLSRLPRNLAPLSTEPPPLGYRGVSIRPVGGSTGVSQIQVFDETVVIDSDVFSDSGRQLEKWLVRTGKPHVTEPLWNAAIKMIRGKVT